jgi:hypothetical protein
MTTADSLLVLHPGTQGRESSMAFIRPPLQIAVDRQLERKGRMWLTGSQPENRDKYALILKRTRPQNGKGKYIDLCCGELSSLLFDDTEVIDGLNWALQNGAEVQIIFSRGKDEKQGMELLKQTNPRLYKLWDSQPKNFSIYWSPVRMKQHFLAISGYGVLFEKPETDESKRPWWAFFEPSPKLATQWQQRFEDYIKTGRLKELAHYQTEATAQN